MSDVSTINHEEVKVKCENCKSQVKKQASVESAHIIDDYSIYFCESCELSRTDMRRLISNARRRVARQKVKFLTPAL